MQLAYPASTVEDQRRRASQSTATQLSSEQTGPSLTYLPAECLHVICQHLHDSDSKIAFMRTCHAARSAVLESCMVLLEMRCPSKMALPLLQPIQNYKQEWVRNAQLLQQAKHVSLCFDFRQDHGPGLVFMHTWLAEMHQQCKGPLVSVRKLTLKGGPVPEITPVATPISTLPFWMPVYCPNIFISKIQDVFRVSTGWKSHISLCDVGLMASRVYHHLKSIELRFTVETRYRSAEDGPVAEKIAALVDAPQLKHVALSLLSPLEHSLDHRECHWQTLHLVDEFEVFALSQLPYKGVGHAVIGCVTSTSYFTLRLADACSRPGVVYTQYIKDACTRLEQYSKVTLSTDGGLLLDCYHLSSAEASLMLPMLKHPRPFALSADKASGTLTLLGIKGVSLEFMENFCRAVPSTITRVGFIYCNLEDGTLQQLVFLLPAHVTGFTIHDKSESIDWEGARTVCEHATRAPFLSTPIVPLLRISYHLSL